MPTITDALAVKSLAQGLELFGLDPGVWLLIAEVGAFLVALGTLGKKGYKAAKVTGGKVYSWVYPPPAPPPELDPMVQDIVDTLQTYEGEWAVNRDLKGGVYQAGNIIAELDSQDGIVRLEVGGYNARMDLTDEEMTAVRTEIKNAVNRCVECQRRQRRESVRKSLHGEHHRNGVDRIPLSTTPKVPVGEPKRIIT